MVARDIVQRLEATVEAKVFFDLQSIELGDEFERQIAEALQRSAVVVVLLGKDWFGPVGEKRRIDAEDDLFRHEIEAALRASARVIPVVVGDQPPPAAADLPGPLKRLSQLQWHRIGLSDADRATDRLVAAVRAAVNDYVDSRLGSSTFAPATGTFTGRFPFPVDGYLGVGSGPEAVGVVYTPEMHLRVNTALVVERPLLVVGITAASRRQFAQALAHHLAFEYYEHALTAQSLAQDLLYSFDNARRLYDTEVRDMRAADPTNYVRWNALGQAFRAVTPATGSVVHVADAEAAPATTLDAVTRVLASPTFTVRESGEMFHRQLPVLALVSAESLRTMPLDLRSRFVICRLPLPSADDLMRIGRAHFGDDHASLVEIVAKRLLDPTTGPTAFRPIDVSQFVDVVKTLLALGVQPDGLEWRVVLDALGVEQ